eukprot:NODE_1765_length_1413_cov_32.037390_g1594_i0.p1 GENE.NODE_1765_length_1413_cov_32.037390_g1594_i0~~NODE_1765_length_1413_cov_32.037390_g1594_i0.p1  ORF type:complete len:428 (+),score=60.17 NODE_1765_length_1413_cov_32.037390_g1594_i0:95-1378(+)
MGGGASRTSVPVLHVDHQQQQEPPLSHAERVIRELQQTYAASVQPVESAFRFPTPEPFLSAKPLVLLIGPFSSGKTSFINSLLGQRCLLSGPHPTTNRFTVVLSDEGEGSDAAPSREISGSVLANRGDLPFGTLRSLGSAFLDNFSGVQVPGCSILKSLTLVDTPGILESAGSLPREYNYDDAMGWFVARSDLVIVMFDPSKLDLGPQLQRVLGLLEGQSTKVRFVLNKVDTLEEQALLRVYGSLLWSLAHSLKSAEPPRIFVTALGASETPGSSGTLPHSGAPGGSKLIDKERADLIHELVDVVPSRAIEQRVSSALEHAKAVYAHARLCLAVRERLPKVFGKDKIRETVLEQVDSLVELVRKDCPPSLAILPRSGDFRKFLTTIDLYSLPKGDEKSIKQLMLSLESAVSRSIPALLVPIAQPTAK